jgi:hypothetical protein
VGKAGSQESEFCRRDGTERRTRVRQRRVWEVATMHQAISRQAKRVGVGFLSLQIQSCDFLKTLLRYDAFQI